MENKTFEQDVERLDVSVSSDLSFQGETTLIAFGGRKGAVGMPPFEFFNISREFKVNKIFIRDLEQCWYQKGINGLGSTILESAYTLREQVRKIDSRRVITIGNSMGGYAAILFGVLINADIIHAFAPQTFIDQENRLLHQDTRWEKQILKVHQIASDTYLDLKQFLNSTTSTSEIHIYYSCLNDLDSCHAQHLIGLPQVRCHPYDHGGHKVVRHLRDSGQLQSIIAGSLS